MFRFKTILVLGLLGLGAIGAHSAEFIVTHASRDGAYQPWSTVSDAVVSVENFEQYRPIGGYKGIIAELPEIRRTFKFFGQELESRFEKAGFPKNVGNPPPKWQPSKSYRDWPGADAWSARVRGTVNPNQRCELLELAYLYAVIKTTLMDPSVAIAGRGPNTMDVRSKDDAFLRDERRAAWAWRFAASVPEKLFPANCHCHGPRYCLYDEVTARWNFIFGPLPSIEGMPSAGTIYKRPLGHAIHMCGRTANAHYIDSEIAFSGKFTAKRFRPSTW